MERMRRDIIYKIFIDHYLQWAKKVRAIRSYSLALIFLFQARRLASLSLDDDPMKDVSEKCEEIESLIESVLIDQNRDSQTKPQLPRRESYADAGSRALFRVKNHGRKGEDPYTNIDGESSTKFDNTPGDINDIENVGKPTMSPKFRKSIIASPRLNDHMARKSHRNILKVQIHTEPNSAASPIMPRSFYSPMTPSSPSSMSTSPKKSKFFNNNNNNEDDLNAIPTVELANFINGLIPTTNGFEPSLHANIKRKFSVTSNASEDYVTEL